MRVQPLTKRQPKTIGETIAIYRTTPETEICLNCDIKKCNGECKRYTSEMKKLKKQKKDGNKQ